MQLHKRFYHFNGIDQTNYSKEAFEREKKLKIYDKLILEGCSRITALEAIQTSKATFYRWKKRYKNSSLEGLENESRKPKNLRKPKWTIGDESLVLKIRKKHRLWGKNKISVIIKREYSKSISASTVGRIISKLVKLGRIRPVRFYYGQTKDKKRRIFDKHAKPWKSGMKAQNLGELIQIDHMSVELEPGKIVKHFKAICPITKLIVVKAYGTASSAIATDFLNIALKKFPFKIGSIQVDGGSEFMKNFEQECKNKNIDLYVLPPRSPECNGTVERANKTVKYEFYHFYRGSLVLEKINKQLQHFINCYNTYRPHQALQYQTPLRYYQGLVAN